MKQYENYPTESKCGATRRSAWPPTRSLTLRSVILGILIFALAISPGAAFALTGGGTPESPYEISNAEELAKFRDIVNNGSAGAHAKLTKNITLSSENWTPIGNYNTPYSGAFDGCGYKITGLKIEGSLMFAGLFGYLNGGSVGNLTLDGVSITPSPGPIAYAGGIAGHSTGGTAINCSVAGEISGDNVGGIFGAAGGTTTVENCSNTSTVNGRYAGGIVGKIYREDNRIAFCSNGGAVNAVSGGGIVGYIDGTKTVLNCCLNNGKVKSTKDAGGIAGRLESPSAAELSSCSNTGDVEANNDGKTQEVKAGGIFGIISNSTTATLTNCSNGGRVTASSNDDEFNSYAGGIAGYINNEGSAIELTYCVNGGEVKAGSSLSGTPYPGGIAGYVGSSALNSVTKCAYPTGMKALGGNSYGGDNMTVSGADARGDADSLVVAVYAEIAPKSIAPGKTATITFKTAPGDNLSNVETLEAPASSRSDVAKVEGWNTGDKTITVTGVSEGTAVIEFSVMLQVTPIGSEPGEPTPRSFAIPVTVTAIPSDPTDPDDPSDPSDPTDPDDPNNPDDPSQPTDPGNSGGGGGGCSAGFGALALLAIAPLALKRRK